MMENQSSISRWAQDTFGTAQPSNISTAVRANKEMGELLRDLAENDRNPHAMEEAADIVILLFVLASRMGGSLMAEVDRKMAINRARAWKVDESGHGYHVRDEVAANG